MLARDPLLPFEHWSLANIVHVVNIIINFSPLPCSDLERGVAMIITAFTPLRFFAQTPIFSVSLSSFSLSPI